MSMIRQKAPELGQVRIEDDFFSPILNTIRTVTVMDVLRKFEHDRGGAIDNFDRVRDGVLGEHAGPEWYDGLTYETITGISDLMIQVYDPVAELTLDSYAARIAAAAVKDQDGYVNTYTQTMEPGHRFGENGGFLRGQHDVYNAGALVEAGVHHYQATGKTTLLDAAVRFACFLCRLMGKPPRKNIIPAHSLPEESLILLYRLFRDDPKVRERYLEAQGGEMFLRLSEFWIENRGVHCGLPDWDNWPYEKCVEFIRSCGYGEGRPCWGAYAQDHMPVLSQRSIEGHAVRATLLYAGLAACAYENGRSDYLEAAQHVWENMALRRMHVTGGVGALPQDEKFGPDYLLPHNAYLETCAAVGAIFFCHNMHLLTGQARYMDCLETILYNGALVGVSQSGTRYSYVNPLVSDGSIHRWDWHQCPCCPPMDLKLYGRLPGMVYAYGSDSVTVNLFISGEASLPVAGGVRIRQSTSYPWQGRTSIAFCEEASQEITLRIRIPDWCTDCRVTWLGNDAPILMEDGYARLRARFRKGDVVTVDFEMPVLLGRAHPKVEACSGQAVLRRGPIIYCLEEADNPGGLQVTLGGGMNVAARFRPELLGGVVELDGTDVNGKPFRAIPYFRWDNRSPGAMRVWLPARDPEKPWTDWENRLYAFERAEGSVP